MVNVLNCKVELVTVKGMLGIDVTKVKSNFDTKIRWSEIHK